MGTLHTVSDDGVTLVVEERDLRGKVICTSYEPSPASEDFKQAVAEEAAVERHRDVLRQQLDPKRPDPSTKAVADAQAFIALAADVGVTEALAVADEVVIALPVDPRGGW